MLKGNSNGSVNKVIYSFDTNVFIEIKKNYPKESNKRLWDIIETRLNNREIVASKEVLEELKKGTDDLGKWLNKYPKSIIESYEAIQDYVGYLVNKYSGWIDTNSTMNQADPYVIAVGNYYKGIVVTQEKLHRYIDENLDQIKLQAHSLKIPNICKLENVRCLDLVGFLVEIGDFSKD